MTDALERAARAIFPAAFAKDAPRRALAAVRKRAWITRRKKYGPQGNSKYRPIGWKAIADD